MYLREMGSVELLSREGEIAIAKRIEAGREAMIAGLCESPLTFQAIIIWRDELNEGKVFLRDIIDLEATYAGPDAKAMPAAAMAPTGSPFRPARVPGCAAPCADAGAARSAARCDPLQGGADARRWRGRRSRRERSGRKRNSTTMIWRTRSRSQPSRPSSSPKSCETFDNVADAYKRLRRLQDQDIEFKLKNTTLSPAQERRYKKLKDDIISEVKSLRLNPDSHRFAGRAALRHQQAARRL